MAPLRRLQTDEAGPAEVRAAARRLTTKVDLERQLSFDGDPPGDERAIVGFAAPQAGCT